MKGFSKDVREEVFIDRLFQASDGVYKLNIVMLIPYQFDYMTVTVKYDQLEQKKIANLAWVKKGYLTRNIVNIFRKQKKPNFERYFAFKKEEFKQHDMNPIANNNEDYDRLASQSYKVYKTFHFDKRKIFGNGRRKFNHFLELEFVDGTKKAIPVKQYVYYSETKDLKHYEKFFPTGLGSGTDPDPDYAPTPELHKGRRDAVLKGREEEFEKANREMKHRQEQEYQQVIQELQKSQEDFGAIEAPEFDGLYR